MGRGCAGTLRGEAPGRAVRSGAGGSGALPGFLRDRGLSEGVSAVGSSSETVPGELLQPGPEGRASGAERRGLGKGSKPEGGRHGAGSTGRSRPQAARVTALRRKVGVWSVPVGSADLVLPVGPSSRWGRPGVLWFVLPRVIALRALLPWQRCFAVRQ